MNIQNGYPFYGQSIGVLVFNQKSPRIPGDAGHSRSFSYPVCYEIVEGGYSELINGSEKIKNNLIDACINLKNKGVSAIIGDCGLMSLYQQEMVVATGIPVAASSLCMIPLLWNLIDKKGCIGVLTGNSDLLSKNHLISSGWNEDINIELQGLQHEPHFKEIVIEGGLNLIPELMEKDIINAGAKLLERNNEVKAIVLECSNIGSYSKSLWGKFRVPVYDLITLTNMIYYSVNPPSYY